MPVMSSGLQRHRGIAENNCKVGIAVSQGEAASRSGCKTDVKRRHPMGRDTSKREEILQSNVSVGNSRYTPNGQKINRIYPGSCQEAPSFKARSNVVCRRTKLWALSMRDMISEGDGRTENIKTIKDSSWFAQPRWAGKEGGLFTS